MNNKIATRRSKLAQVQADIIIDLIKVKQNIQFEKFLMETEGDRRLDVSLDKIGGKGLFVKEIEMALIEGKAKAAVHSMKDVPYEIEQCFEIAAIPLREDARDVFISSDEKEFNKLPKGARVGTSSKRRAAQLGVLRPDIEFVPVRGNVQTRLEKIKKENLNGIILAYAGIKRLKMDSLITNYFSEEEVVPAVAQGALGIETLKKLQDKAIFTCLDDENIRVCVEAERSFMKTLQGGCHTTVGAFARLNKDIMHIIGVFEINGKIVKKDISGSRYDYINLGEELAKKIIKSR